MGWLVLFAALFLACSNGSNDNFKGVATLYGSGVASYRTALAWATATTLAGSVLALVFAAGLVRTFSAKGLVPDATAASHAFLGAVALAAAITVGIASIAGLPISTTHALTGGLLGAGLAAVGSKVNAAVLGTSFFLPLALSPIVAVALASIGFVAARATVRTLGIAKDSCVCVGAEQAVGVSAAGEAVATASLTAAVSSNAVCVRRYGGTVLGISADRALDWLHFASAGAVSFARGLNDTPKIVALLIAAKVLGAQVGIAAIAVTMAAGGILGARKVAETMSLKITALDPAPAFVANLNTAFLVLIASRFGLPVSTTHVSTGSLFGIGLITREARWKTIASILAAWLTTLPVAALLAALIFLLLARH